MKHMRKKNWLTIGVTAALALSLLTACGETRTVENADSTSAAAAADTSTTTEESAMVSQVREALVSLSDATTITLNGSSAEIDGSGATVSDGVVTITAAGAYVLNGTWDGQVIVNAKKEDVTLVFNGVEIDCSYGSPLYVYKAATVTVLLKAGTENILRDGETYTYAGEYDSADDEEPNACLYSKADLMIQGDGVLTVYGNYNNGITSKDSLTILSGNITVEAENNGITGKDSCDISGGNITVTSGGDAIRSTNDTDDALGWLRVSGGTLNLTSGEKGLLAQMDITLSGGNFTLNCTDDAVHSKGNLTVSGGTFDIVTGDDAFHADNALTVDGGEIQITESHEGLEASAITINNGTIGIVSDDDGVNAGGYASLVINGGWLYVDAGGDGLDSNGTMEMNGGTVIVSSTGTADGALDYDGSFAINGGTLLAIDYGNMPAVPSTATQNTIYVNFGNALPAGTVITLTNGEQEIEFPLNIQANSFVYSSDELESGATYTVSYRTSENAEATTLTTLTLDNTITTYGNAGFGGGFGGMGAGGFGGMGQGGRGGRGGWTDGQSRGMDGNMPEFPGDMPEMPDGTPDMPNGTPEAPDGMPERPNDMPEGMFPGRGR